MDNLKKGIAILTIVILIIITALIILRLKGKEDNLESDFANTQFENIDTYEAENKIEKVKNKNKYYAVQRIIDTYIQYIKEVFKLSEGEAAFLTTCARGQGLFKVGEQTAIIEIRPTKKEFEFIETNVNKLKERQS